MILFLIITSSVLATYIFIIFLFYRGWLIIPGYDHISDNQEHSKINFYSVLIPVHNGAESIEKLIMCIDNQVFNKKYFEIIIINDNSTDSTFTIVENLNKSIDNLVVINADKNIRGKKSALLKGINIAKGNIIITTDADCNMDKFWLQGIDKCFAFQNPDLLIGAVIMEGVTFFQKLQCVEFSSLVASGAGAAGIGHPIMCNGANLAYSKEFYNKITDPMKIDVASGDDMFLLHNFKKAGAKILYNKNRSSVVYTKAQPNLQSFVNQRVRWGAKSKYYSDSFTIFVAITVFLLNFINLVLFGLGFFKIQYFGVLCIYLLIKSLPDYILIKAFSSYFKQKINYFHFIIIQVFYFVYIIAIALIGFFAKPKTNVMSTLI